MNQPGPWRFILKIAREVPHMLHGPNAIPRSDSKTRQINRLGRH
jgi:hypothetical protein